MFKKNVHFELAAEAVSLKGGGLVLGGKCVVTLCKENFFSQTLVAVLISCDF